MSSDPFTLAWLREEGFDGFVTIEDLRARRARVPNAAGVYLVCRESTGPGGFLEQNAGGWFKGRDPSVPVDKLDRKWVDKAYVVYIGKADVGSAGARGVRVRLDEYMRFGQGEPVGHWGGRYLWQLSDVTQMLVCWKLCRDPVELEADLIEAFRVEYGALPFANLKAGTKRQTQDR